jgi:hypothetical protein
VGHDLAAELAATLEVDLVSGQWSARDDDRDDRNE